MRGLVECPRLLEIGDCVWIGKGVWIDNLYPVRVGGEVLISQGTYLYTGNQDDAAPSFAFFTSPQP